MGSMSIWHWLIVLAVVLVLFGGGSKISSLMGDFGKGLKSFKKNIAEDDTPAQPTQVTQDASYHAPQPGSVSAAAEPVVREPARPV
ncbi:sec-independent protein translocase protein TatA [Endobacter medicaginis]|jgi:sec-independent protein translocase protein TatA|uniref:Sec-independent protein translocase protein TatA n=1 Tax=Endobacter medicaginis TaxID=1181271 RepID=A0A850NRP8_9PROT|nr:sec-independent protein translocase protein TatA [Endobacter medicaginis]NVN30506.1 twin-arginine translocase TatA/TatE family subunit [Endobacter medicaginis]